MSVGAIFVIYLRDANLVRVCTHACSSGTLVVGCSSSGLSLMSSNLARSGTGVRVFGQRHESTDVVGRSGFETLLSQHNQHFFGLGVGSEAIETSHGNTSWRANGANMNVDTDSRRLVLHSHRHLHVHVGAAQTRRNLTVSAPYCQEKQY